MGADEIKMMFANKGSRKALIAYLCAGDPDLPATIELVDCLVAAGVDMVELGVPFSDPLADGPVIQAAAQRSLENGTTLAEVLKAVGEIKRVHKEFPVVLMGYYNPFMSFGLQPFAEEAAQKGVSGVIVPDLPFEEAHYFREILERQSLGFIPFVAPTTTKERMAKILADQYPFIYCISLTGVTGVREAVPEGLLEFMTAVRNNTDNYLALGFGISTAEQAAIMGKLGDGIIVGSAFVKLVEKFKQNSAKVKEELTALVHCLKQGLDG